MVLYKRKPVTVHPPPQTPPSADTEVFYIPQTHEWFVEYEDYLARIDYYSRRKFVCEITGNACLTFFEALESEAREIKGVEKNFPEALREHILRFLQFNRITRLDQLVDKVYAVFKNDYFPGEHILIKGLNMGPAPGDVASVKQRGVIREKVQYNNAIDGPMTKYLVVRSSDQQQAIVTKDKIARDRNHFTKWLIKTFIKLTMTRSHKIGAPWVVKDKFAKKYRIPQEYPRDLKQYEPVDSSHEDHDIAGVRTPEPMGRATKKQSKPPATKKLNLNSIMDEPIETVPIEYPDFAAEPRDHKTHTFPTHYLPERIRRDYKLEEEGINSERGSPIYLTAAIPVQPTKKNLESDLKIKFDLQHSKPIPYRLTLPENAWEWNQRLAELYDKRVQLETKDEQQALVKKEAEDSDDINEDDEESQDSDNDDTEAATKELLNLDSHALRLKHVSAVQEALECWVFVNMYHSALKIDTFTFDDFIYCMGWNSTQYEQIGRCELLDEIWCALLGAVVSNKIPKNDEAQEYKKKDEIYGIQVIIPPKKSYINPIKSEEEGELVNGSESEADHSNMKTLGSDVDADDDSDSDMETTRVKKPIRSNIKQDDGEEGDDEQEEEDRNDEDNDEMDEDTKDSSSGAESDDEEREHNAYIAMNHRDIPWHDRLRKRNFRDGNWQTILLGVLSLVEHVPKFKPIIETVYKVLCPIELPANPNSALTQFYKSMDLNLRLRTLSILCTLLSTSPLIRKHIDTSMEKATALRRRRLDNMKDAKITMEKSQILSKDIFDKYLELTNNTNNEEVVKRRHLIISHTTEMTEHESEVAAKDEAFAKLCEERSQLLKQLEEFRDDRKDIERGLVELDCQRVKLLGKDRLYNRYWWFENNGLPTLHGNAGDEDNEDDEKEKDHEDSEEEDNDEVLEETYLMGRLWVQGPSHDDLTINLNAPDLADYRTDEDHFEIKRILPYDENDPDAISQLQFDDFPVNFLKLASEKFGIYFDSNKILLNNSEVIIDNYGGLTDDFLVRMLLPAQRKVIEECPDPLFNGAEWRYYDEKDDIDSLIHWLNPYGERENQLRKELIGARDAILSSIASRKKALSQNTKTDEQKKLEEDIKVIEEKIALCSDKPHEFADEDSQEIEVRSTRKRALRANHASKKQKKSFQGILENGSIEEMKNLKQEYQEKLDESVQTRQLSRVQEWVNSLALNQFDKSLYDGGDRSRGRSWN